MHNFHFLLCFFLFFPVPIEWSFVQHLFHLRFLSAGPLAILALLSSRKAQEDWSISSALDSLELSSSDSFSGLHFFNSSSCFFLTISSFSFGFSEASAFIFFCFLLFSFQYQYVLSTPCWRLSLMTTFPLLQLLLC